MVSKRAPYHHGSLRTALVSGAVELLRQGGPEALTLRAVARHVGVSQTAPYRHFEDRRALVAAVAEDGFTRMAAYIQRSIKQGPAGLEAFRRGLRAYVRFAAKHPAEYRIMFGAELAERADLPGLQTAARAALEVLRAGIARLQGAGIFSDGDAHTRAVSVWGMLHGVAMLIIDKQAGATQRSVEELIDASIELAVLGLNQRGA